MLAIVHPLQPNTPSEALHCTSTTARPPRHPRKPNPCAVSSSSSSSTVPLTSTPSSRLSSALPHTPTRQITVPTVSASTPVGPKHVRSRSAAESQQLPGSNTPIKVSRSSRTLSTLDTQKFEYHKYPATELLRLIASLLSQIAATNDKLSTNTSTSDESISSPPLSDPHPPIWRTLTNAARTALTNPSTILNFHARNIPTITLEAYLLRILKYCPLANQVFLSLLVYFDRMSKLSYEATGRVFVIDSYNIHRLVIAGVTVASKFFSDVFYTNSRYAKVGGLPQQELNQLELQFLLLNDFRLSISTEELQHYAEQLLAFAQSGIKDNLSFSSFSSFQPRTPQSTSTTGSSLEGGAPLDDVQSSSRSQTRTNSRGTNPNPYLPPAHDPARYNRPPLDPMGAGGPILITNPDPVRYNHAVSDPLSAGSSNVGGNKTPSFRPQKQHFRGKDVDEELGTETDGGATTDGGETTDDEPTIRPGHSSASSEADTWSCASVSTTESEDEGVEVDEEDGEMEMEVGVDEIQAIGNSRALSRHHTDISGHHRGGGDLTPEKFGRGRGRRGSDVDDHRMTSP